jgi:hypothetical protein
MSMSQRDALRDLLRRVDEVRGLAEAERPSSGDLDDASVLIRTVGELVEELERSHRRLIETNVQLVSLREVASSMVSSLDTGETTRTVTRYLRRAFGFEDAFLLLIDRERVSLAGTWTLGASTATGSSCPWSGARARYRAVSFSTEPSICGTPGAIGLRTCPRATRSRRRSRVSGRSPACHSSAASRSRTRRATSCAASGASSGMRATWCRRPGRGPNRGRSSATRGSAIA